MAEISILFPGLPLSPRTVIGVSESLSEIGDVSAERTWDGKAILMAPTWGRLFAVDLSNDGEAVWMPSWDNLKRGDTVRLYSSEWQSTTLGPGVTSAVLSRDPVPGITTGRDVADPRVRVPVNVNGRNVSIAARARATEVRWRMALDCMILGISMSGSATGRQQSWKLRLEEVSP